MNSHSLKLVTRVTNSETRFVRPAVRLATGCGVVAIIVFLATSVAAQAASGSWNDTAATGDWTTGPWTGGTPGVSGTAAGNTDIATFGNVGTVAHTVTDAVTNREIGEILLNGTGSGSNYTIGGSGNNLYFNTTGTLSSSAANTSTIASNIYMTSATTSSPSSPGKDLSVLVSGTTGTLTISGSISTVAAAGSKVSDLGITTSNVGDLVDLTGTISDGGSSHAGVMVSHTGPGTVLITGANTYSGGYVSGNGATSVTQIGVNSVGSVGAITSSAFGTGTLYLNGGKISSDGTTARTILNNWSALTPANYFGDTTNTGTLTFAGNGTLSTSGTFTFLSNATFSGNISGTGGLTLVGGAATPTTVIMSGLNTYGVATTISGNITLSSGATGYLGYSGTVPSSIGATPYYNSGLVLDGGTYQNVNTSNLEQYTQHLFTITANGGTLDNSGAGNLFFYSSSAIAASGTGNRTLTLTGTNTSENTIAAILVDPSTGSTSVAKTGAGTWALSGVNTYTGSTTVSAGTLVAENAKALGNNVSTNNVTVAAGAGLDYQALATGTLAIGGNLSITGGAGTVLGGSIGSTTTNAEINVAGAATLSNAPLTVNVYGVSGVTAVTGTYTLLQGGAGSSLNPATAPTLGMVYNNYDFTVGAVTDTSSAIQVGVTKTTGLTTAYWVGGLAGGSNVWAASNGSTTSNWATTAGGSVQALTPGSTTSVIFSATSPTTAPTATVLGSNMTINNLTIADTVNGLGLIGDGNTLTIAPTSSSTGITVNASVPNSTIGANILLGAAQTWTNNSLTGTLTIDGTISSPTSPALTVSGAGNTVISSTITTGHDTLTKTGTGTLTLSGISSNSYDRLTLVTGGELDLGKTLGAVAISGSLTLGNGTGATDSDVVKLLGSNQIITTSAVVINSDGQLALNGYSNTTGSLTSVGGDITSTTGSGTLTVTAAPMFSGGATVTNTIGAGATLSSANTATLTSASNLAVNGTLSDSLSMSSSSNLSGTGAITGAVSLTGSNTLGSSGTLATGAVSVSGSGNTISSGTISGGGTINSGGVISVGSGATWSGSIGINSGGTLKGQGTAGAVTLNSGGAIDLTDGVIGTLTIGSLTTTGGGALTFDIGGGTTNVDKIADLGALTASSLTTINLNAISGSLSTGTYTFLSYGSGSASIGNFQLTGGASSLSIDGKTLTLAQSGDNLEIVVASSTTSTTYTLGTVAASTLLHSGATTTLTTTVTNIGTGIADTLDYSGLGATATNGTVTGTTTSGGPLANNSVGTGTNTQTYTATTAGSDTITPTGTGTNATLGGSATQTGTTTATINVYSGVGVWNHNGGGTWGTVSVTPTNWTANGGTPGITAGFLNTDSASFGTILASGTGSVTLDGDNPSLNAITFNDSAASYVIAQGTGTGSITLDGNGGNANVTDVAGTHTISAPIDLATSANVNVASGQQLTVSDTISGTGGLVNNGAGTTILSGSNGYSGGTTVSFGTLQLSNGSGSATGSGALSVGAGAILAGTGSSNGSSFSITGSSSTRTTVLVGHNTASDLNTTSVMSLQASGASSIGSANLVFNLNANSAGQGNQLSVGATAITFNTVGSQNTTLTLNLQGADIIASGTDYILVAGTTASGGSGQLGSQYTGLDLGTSVVLSSGITETQILNSNYGGTGSVNLSFGSANSYYGANSSLFLYQNTNTGQDDIEVEVVPEPGTWAMMLGGLACLIFFQRRRRKSFDHR